MNFEHRKCLIHNEPIYYLCTKNHRCTDRRLCPLCVDEDHKPMQIPVVKQRLTERLCELRNRQQQSNLDGPIKFLELQAQDLINELKTITQQSFFLINNIDGSLLEMLTDVLDKKKEILDFRTQEQFNRIINLIEDTTFTTKCYQNQEKIKRIGMAISQFTEQFKQIQQNVKKLLNNRWQEQVLNNIVIEGPTVLGLKHGEFYYHHTEIPQINFAGKYQFDQKIGFWMEFTETFQGDQKICFLDYQRETKIIESFGSFNQNKNKEGMWLESTGQQNQIIEYGNYNDGIRVDDWLIIDNAGRECGGGKYNKKGKKIDFWTEVGDCYSADNPIQYRGKYHEGSRRGKWEIFQNGEKIGYGELDDFQMKQGLWRESIAKQNEYETFIGNYKDSIRQGLWQIYQNKNHTNGLDDDSLEYLKAIGQFDSKGDKTGVWNDIQKNGIKEIGEYRSNQRQGDWQAKKNKEILWEGCYFDNQKTGKWIQYLEYPYNYEIGNYAADKRIGSWQIYKNNELVGEGELQENGIKKGPWIEYSEDGQLKMSGKYENGKKSGKWNIRRGQQIIEEGEYNEFNQKQGPWIEYKQVHDEESILLFFLQPITLNLKLKGQYNNGKKVGLWKAYNEIDEEVRKYDKQF